MDTSGGWIAAFRVGLARSGVHFEGVLSRAIQPAMPDEPKFSEELKKMDYEPLLPVEKKRIGWSLAMGAALLGLLIWISAHFFPG